METADPWVTNIQNLMNKVPNFRKIAEETLKEVPHKVADIAIEHFNQSFDKEGFTDFAFAAWPLRKDDLGHKLLQKSETLKKSIRASQVTLKMIEIVAGEGLPYAAIHNEGGTISTPVTEKMRKFFWYMFLKTDNSKWKHMAMTKKERLTIKIPARKYIGNSNVLNTKIDEIFMKTIIEKQAKLKF